MSDGKSGFLTPPEEFIHVHVGYNISMVYCQEKIVGHGIRELQLSYFLRFLLNGSLSPETSAHFNRLFETSSSPRATASNGQSKQCRIL